MTAGCCLELAAKLDDLRARTNRELIAIIFRLLDRGLEIVREDDNMERRRREAGKVYHEALNLLAAVDTNGSQCRRLERKLIELQSAL